MIQKRNPSINRQFDVFPSILKLNKVNIPNNNLNRIMPQTPRQPIDISAIQEDGTETIAPDNQSLSHSPSNQNNSNAPQFRHHAISPNISKRINSLLNNSRSNMHQMTLRSNTMRRHTSTPVHHTP